MTDYIKRVAEAVREMASNIANEYAYLSGDDNAYSAANSIMSKIDDIDLDAIIASVAPDVPSGLTDEEIAVLAKEHLAPCFDKLSSFPRNYADTEQCKRATEFARAIEQRVRGGHEPVGYVSQQALKYLANNSTTIISSKGMADDEETIPLYLAPPLAVPDGVLESINALLNQIDIGDFTDSQGHSAKMLKPVHDLMRLLTAPRQEDQP